MPLYPLIVVREKLARSERARQPEPMVMDEPQGVAEYHQIGATVQVGAHHFNALAISRLLPKDGTLVDLGCGSGRLLARLAHGRPDVTIIGLDLSEPMLETGRSLLEREGLADRVDLRRGDITTFDGDLVERPDVVSCSFALHQLPSEELASACLGAIARVRANSGCAVWIFDFARLRHPRSWPAFTSILTWPGEVILHDAIASEAAAFTSEELKAMLKGAGLGELQQGRSRPLGELQVAWAESREGLPAASDLWRDSPLPPDLAADPDHRPVVPTLPDAALVERKRPGGTRALRQPKRGQHIGRPQTRASSTAGAWVDVGDSSVSREAIVRKPQRRTVAFEGTTAGARPLRGRRRDSRRLRPWRRDRPRGLCTPK